MSRSVTNTKRSSVTLILQTHHRHISTEFLHLVRSAILATDVANSSTQQIIQDRFERLINESSGNALEATQTVVEQILLMADVGHCSQSYENFLKWNEYFFNECLANHKNGLGFDPRLGWHDGEIEFLEG